MCFPPEIWSIISRDLSPEALVRLNVALPPSDRLPWSNEDSRLGLIDYAMRHSGTFVPSKEVIQFVGNNINNKIAKSIWPKFDRRSLDVRIYQLEWAMTKGEYTDYSMYPHASELSKFNCYYGLLKHLGKLSVDKFEAFKSSGIYEVLFGVHESQKIFMEGCNPVLMEYVLWQISEDRLPWKAVMNSELLSTKGIAALKAAGVPDERWPKILHAAIAAGKFDIADLIMDDGHRLGGPRIIKEKKELQQDDDRDPCARILAALNDSIDSRIKLHESEITLRRLYRKHFYFMKCSAILSWASIGMVILCFYQYL